MEEKTRVKLKICGNEFVIIADETEEYIHTIAKLVDNKIKENNENNEKISLPMATILTALNYCDELEKERKITKELLKKADACESSANKANADLARFAIENAQLQEEKKGLHKVIAELKEQLSSTARAERHSNQSAAAPTAPKNGFRPQKPKGDSYKTKKINHIPKINYQGNDNINDEYRRKEFDDPSFEDETLSFFDHRDS